VVFATIALGYCQNGNKCKTDIGVLCTQSVCTVIYKGPTLILKMSFNARFVKGRLRWFFGNKSQSDETGVRQSLNLY